MQMNEMSHNLFPPTATIIANTELNFTERGLKTSLIDSKIQFVESFFMFPQTIDFTLQSVTKLLQNGWLIIPETPIQIQIQKMSHRVTKKGFRLLIELENGWPNIELSGSRFSPSQIRTQTQVRFLMKNSSPQSGVYATRLAWLLAQKKHFCLQNELHQTQIECQTPVSSVEWRNSIQILGRFYRKARFIEKSLNSTVSIPYPVTPEMLDELDRVFRGLLRKNIVVEVDTVSATFKTPMLIDVTAIPECGVSPLSFEAEGIWLFGQKLSDIHVLTFIPQGRILNFKEVAATQQNSGTLVAQLRSENGKAMIFFKDQIDRKIEFQRFYQELTVEEPEEIAQEVVEPMWGSVTRFEAMELALNSLQERYSGKISIMGVEEIPENGVWKVQIGLPEFDFDEYAVGKFIFVDQMTGDILPKDTNVPEIHHSREEKRFIASFRWACNRTWLKRNRDRYIGEWVSLSEGILVSHGKDLSEVLKTARAKGYQLPLVTYIEPAGEKMGEELV